MKRTIEYLAAIVLLFLAYFVSYLALLEPLDFVILDGHSGYRVRTAGYRIGNGFVATAFEPLLRLDHFVRPKFWEWEQLGYGSSPMK